jgi:hypothetical protein
MNDDLQESDWIDVPIFRAGVLHIGDVIKRAQGGSQKDRLLIKGLRSLRTSQSGTEIVVNYLELARSLRGQVLGQLAKRQGVEQQGEFFK